MPRMSRRAALGRIAGTAVTIGATGGAVAVDPATAAADEAKTNTTVVRTLYKRLYTDGDLTVVDELFSPQYVEQQAGAPRDLAALSRGVAALHASFPNLRVRIEDLLATPEKVWVRASVRGTNTGSIGTLPGTGRRVRIEWVDIYRMRDGRIVEHWGVRDELSMYLQLGFQLWPPQAKPAN